MLSSRFRVLAARTCESVPAGSRVEFITNYPASGRSRLGFLLGNVSRGLLSLEKKGTGHMENG